MSEAPEQLTLHDKLRRLHALVIESLLEHFESAARSGKLVRVAYMVVALNLLKWEGVKAPRTAADAKAALAKLQLVGQDEPFKH